MANTPIYYPDEGGPTSFGLTDWTDPMTYVAWCNYVISENIKVMEEAGIVWNDNVPDETVWNMQSSTLTDQSNIVSALAGDENLPAAWASRLSSIGSIISSLLAFTMDPAYFAIREVMITLVETIINSAAGQIINPGEEQEDLIEVLKAAFLQETFPGSGVYEASTLQAIKDLKYNDEILEIPATPRPIRIHLQSKTIQT